MKKTALFVLSALCALPAFAEPSLITSVPPEATPLYGFYQNGRNGAECVLDLSGAVRNKDTELDVEYKCQTIFYKWSHESTWSKVRAQVGVYCLERNYDQKVVLSLARRCEANPTEECLSEKVKSAIQTVQPVVRYDIRKSDAEEALQMLPPGGALLPAPAVVGRSGFYN